MVAVTTKTITERATTTITEYSPFIVYFPLPVAIQSSSLQFSSTSSPFKFKRKSSISKPRPFGKHTHIHTHQVGVSVCVCGSVDANSSADAVKCGRVECSRVAVSLFDWLVTVLSLAFECALPHSIYLHCIFSVLFFYLSL